MITVILPTMLIPDGVADKIQEWSKSPFVKEIIVINNTNTEIDTKNNPKVIQIVEGENKYVVPAWNKGYLQSSSDILCFANDDIDFDIDVFEFISNNLTKDMGMVGMDEYHGNGVWEDEPGCDRSRSEERRGKRFPMKLKEVVTDRKPGFACIWFIHKENYIRIPQDMKIFFNDDILYYYQIYKGRKNYALMNFDIVGKVGQTTIKPWAQEFMRKDRVVYIKYSNNYSLLEAYNGII